MNESSSLSANKQALLKIRELKSQLATLEREGSRSDAEPIAVVSMACRFPKSADTPEKFWQSLIRQDDLVGDIPEDRWDMEAFFDEDPEVPGKMYARRGVFLDNLSQMDPEFFGISPREATWVDPQQRLLMEVGWEAIERAGWIPEEIGDGTGVFVGWMHNDYQNEASDSFLNLNPYIATGAAGSFLSGRLAWYLGLKGPSLAVDTACSSSLVALHLAIQSLTRRDCDRALVGGVNAICSPTTNILTCKLKALSPSGHSRAFDAAADGYLRGEGCGVVTLRRLADAQRDGDRVLGIIRGSAIGHNGAGSGLTVPNPKAQEDVIRKALSRAGLQANEVDYLEAHGTGTSLGDPIEVNAAAAAYCQQRTSDDPLLIGSVKTNIGHLEAAAGMAGLIKVLLSLQKGSIPGQMNFETPNPHIAWDKTPVKVLTGETAWPNSKQRRAGVSAFGMSGTNAHVILEAPDSVFEAESASEVTPQDSKHSIVTLSGKTEDAVLDLAESWATAITEDKSIDLTALAHQSNVARSHFNHRAAFATTDRDQAKQLLQTLARGGKADGLFVGSSRRKPRVAWLFTGQGAQFVGMGRQLYETQPVFREVIDHCNSQLKDFRAGSQESSLLDVLFSDESESPQINNTHWTQPAIFAIQMGLVKLLQSWNLQPDIVLGHSVGQYAAACVAGVMSWENGLRLIAERGRLIGELPEGGLMMAVFAPAEAITPLIENDSAVSLAAHNGTHVVISGESDSIKRVEAELNSRGTKSKILTTSHAFHSNLMQPALEPFAQFANSIEYSSPTMPLICNVSGKVLAADATLDGKYWADHIRAAVAFAPSIETIIGMDCDLLVEIGPQSVLTRMAAAKWSKGANSLVSCLQKDLDDNASIANAIAQQYVHGVRPNFRAMHTDAQGSPAAHVDLPTYPFQRRRFWGPDKPRAAHAEFHTAHPLLGSKISLAGADDETRFESHIDVDSPSWMPDHEVMNSIVLPGAALLEMAIEAAEYRTIDNVVFEQPIRPAGRTSLQTVVRKVSTESDSPDGDAKDRLETFARAANSQNWQRHFSCDLVSGQKQSPAALDFDSLSGRLGETESAESFYEKMTSLGLNYGPAFRCITQLRFSETEVLADLQVAGDVRGYNIPPTLLDAALHSLAVGLLRSGEDHLFLPVGIGKLSFFAPIETEAVCHATWKQNEGKNRSADLTLFSRTGQPLLAIEDLKVQQVSLAALRQMSGAGAERLVFDLRWKPNRLPATKLEPRKWLLVCETDSESAKAHITSQIQKRIVDDGHQVLQLAPATTHESWIETFETHASDDGQTFFDGVVWLAAENGGPDVFSANAKSLVAFTQAMIEKNWRQLPCGMLLVTQNAIAVEESAIAAPEHTQLWGLARVISAEQPGLRCRMVDVCPEQLKESNAADSISDLALTETNDNQFAIRNGQFYSPRMVQTRLTKSAKSTPLQADPEGAYLITGGLGKLGRHAAKWLADRGAGQVVLVSRRQLDDETMAFIETITATGCEAVVHAADISQRYDVESLLQRFGSDLHPLKGIIHAAGVLDDGLIESQTDERFEKVLRPKIVAAKLLDELTREMELEFFVLYSSAASVLGSPGQSNYATGNAFLDGLVWQRRAANLPGLAINWGPWTEGMADDERILKRLALQGITPLGIDEAHSALEKMIANDTVQATVMDVDWRKMRIGPTGDVPAMLQELAGPKKKGRAATSALVNKLRSLRGNARRELLMNTIQSSLQQILSTPEAPETDRPLIEMGLDSLMAVEFGTELQQMLGDQFNVGPTMLFDHPTIDAICDHVLELVQSEGADDSAKSATVAAKETANTQSTMQREDIAVIGMSCRFPGARDVHEFWQNLLDGVDSVGQIPSDRWDVDRFYSEDREPGKMYTREGGFLDDIAEFDAAFFNISDQEACWIDPQHRMLLENSYRAMEDAGVPTSPLKDSNVGVFMGIMGSDYAFLPKLDDDHIIKGFQGAGLSHSAGVGRISYIFGFEGPSVSVDTASSSSLVAVYQAMRSLQEGNCNMALAGGVNAILVPVNSLLMSKAGLLSPDGRCKSFSKSADGFGRGEGCGVVVLKRLSDAQRDGDRVMAVIRGGAVVHNGFSSGITSPSGKAQSRVIGAAIKDAGVSPAQVQYLEAHGTGTELGDPMEIAAAMKVYAKGRNKKEPLLVGSVKANISHLEAAGGSSGLIKTVLALHHGVIPQQIHFEEPSQHIPWKRMPAKMVTENTPWPECEQPTAGITALGLVGTNAHLILSSPEASDSDGKESKEDAVATQRLLVASARCEASLSRLKLRYADWLEQNTSVDLDDFCSTLAAGRRHHEHRIAFGFRSREEAVERLRDKPQNGNGKPATTAISSTSPKVSWIFNDDHGDCESELQQLNELSPTVCEFLDECQQRLRQHTGDDSISIFDAGESGDQLIPYLLQASLCKLWQLWGIEADSANGIGVGQYTAACTAGCLCFLDAMVLVYERDQWIDRGSKVDELADFESLADQFNFYPPNLPLWCSLEHEIIPTHRSPGGSYWRRQLETEFDADQAIRFDRFKNAIEEAEFTLGLIAGKSDEGKSFSLAGTNMIHCLGNADSVSSEMTALLATLYLHGCSPDFETVFRSETRTPLSLPVYPFQKKRYWITEIADHMPSEDQPETKIESTLT